MIMNRLLKAVEDSCCFIKLPVESFNHSPALDGKLPMEGNRRNFQMIFPSVLYWSAMKNRSFLFSILKYSTEYENEKICSNESNAT